MYHFNPQEDIQTKYIVFAGPGGSGKTSAACAAAVSLADHGHRTLFIGTDAISHLSELFDMQLTTPTTTVPQIPKLDIMAIDPLQDFEHVFLQLEQFLMNPKNRFRYSYVIADIWDTEWILQELLSPLFSDHHELMDVLTDPSQTSAFLVSRPLTTEFCKTAQAVQRLRSIGITNLLLLVNSLALRDDGAAARIIYQLQQKAICDSVRAARTANSHAFVFHLQYIQCSFLSARGLLHIISGEDRRQRTASIAGHRAFHPNKQSKARHYSRQQRLRQIDARKKSCAQALASKQTRTLVFQQQHAAQVPAVRQSRRVSRAFGAAKYRGYFGLFRQRVCAGRHAPRRKENHHGTAFAAADTAYAQRCDRNHHGHNTGKGTRHAGNADAEFLTASRHLHRLLGCQSIHLSDEAGQLSAQGESQL